MIISSASKLSRHLLRDASGQKRTVDSAVQISR